MGRGWKRTAACGAIWPCCLDTTIDYTLEFSILQGFLCPNTRMCGQRYAGTEQTLRSGHLISTYRLARIVSPDKAGRRRQYRVYGKPAQRSMAERDLPRCLLDSRNLSLIGQLPEADTADAVVPEVGVGTAADLAAVVAAAGELGLPLLLQDHRLFRHNSLPPP